MRAYAVSVESAELTSKPRPESGFEPGALFFGLRELLSERIHALPRFRLGRLHALEFGDGPVSFAIQIERPLGLFLDVGKGALSFTIQVLHPLCQLLMREIVMRDAPFVIGAQRHQAALCVHGAAAGVPVCARQLDRKSTRLNSSH